MSLLILPLMAKQSKPHLQTGAIYNICKPFDFGKLKYVFQVAITLVGQNNVQPTKVDFYMNKLKN